VQSNILSRDHSPGLWVFVVWVPFLGGTRDAINPSILPGCPGHQLVGWLCHLQPVVLPACDPAAGAYLGLLSPVWPGCPVGAVPGPVLSQGGPVIGVSSQLLAAIQPLLR
jgi:hypothetical protein